jgi:hypothetical protein
MPDSARPFLARAWRCAACASSRDRCSRDRPAGSAAAAIVLTSPRTIASIVARILAEIGFGFCGLSAAAGSEADRDEQAEDAELTLTKA